MNPKEGARRVKMEVVRHAASDALFAASLLGAAGSAHTAVTPERLSSDNPLFESHNAQVVPGINNEVDVATLATGAIALAVLGKVTRIVENAPSDSQKNKTRLAL